MRHYGKYKHAAPGKNAWLWIPVGICVLVALLFLFGVLPLKAAEPLPAATPAPTGPAMPALSDASPATPTPAPEEPAPTPETGPAAKGKPSGAPHTRYELAAELRPSHDRLYAKLRVEYQNVTPDTLYELMFHLYPNAFADANGPGAKERGYHGGFDAGRMIVSAVSLDGELAYFTVSDDGMLLHVPFVKELAPGESTQVFIEFVVDVPTRDARFGRTELGFQLGNFLPMLAVYQDGAWVMDGYQTIGDPYYSEAADYAVALSYPSNLTLGCTGSVVSSETRDGVTTSYIAAGSVRDFACVLGSGMRRAEETYEGVRIYSYALSDASAERGAKLAKKALEVMTPLIGGYPYETLTVAQVNMYYAGMEYPNLLMVQRELYLPGREVELELTVAHELIHQWFYGVVGSDQVNAPWIDEAVTSYLSLVYFENAGSQSAYDALFTRYIVERAALGGRVDGALSDYATEEAYVNSVYWRGAALYHALRQKLGDEDFFEGLRVYLRDNAYKVAIKEDIVAAFEAASGEELAAWFDEMLAAPAAQKADGNAA